jgi:hypothetical protein
MTILTGVTMYYYVRPNEPVSFMVLPQGSFAGIEDGITRVF